MIKLTIMDEVNIKFTNMPVEIRRAISNSLKFELPHARHMPQYKLGRWDGTTTFFGIGGNGYLNHLEHILSIIESKGADIDEIEDLRKPYDFQFNQITENYWADLGKIWPDGHPIEGQPVILRDYQVEAVNQFLTNPQCLQELATSAGKSAIIFTLSALCEPYGRTMVIVPNKSLVVQTEEDYKNLGLDVGVYFGDRKELNHTHTIITWQSLESLNKKKNDNNESSLIGFINDVVCVIVDECHGIKGNVLRTLLTERMNHVPIRWGLTGTIPKEEINYQCLFSAIGPVVNQIKAHELQEQGYLSNCHVHVKQLMDFKAFKSYQEELKYLVSDSDRLEVVANMCNEIKDSGNTLILVDRIEAGQKLQEMIPDSVFVSGNVKLKDRKKEYDAINVENCKIVIATFGIAATGLNLPRVFNLVLFEPGKSFIRVIQSIGRGVRKAADKDFVNIYDVTSTCKYSKRHLAIRKKFYADAKYPFSVQKIDWQKGN